VPDKDWVVEPIVPRGRGVVIYGPPKAGKSLFLLDISAAAATGNSVLGQPPRNRVPVLYLDFEMTEDDVRERLTDLGYGPASDLSGLTYLQTTLLPPLDTQAGGDALMVLVERFLPELVVVDTMASGVEGEESSADTYRSFYRWAGRRLKEAGVALLRIDHEGKERGKGQRGSSAKRDDVDVVFRIVRSAETNLRLMCTHSRVPWVPREVSIMRHLNPVLRHVVAIDSWPAGTMELAATLDEIGVPLDASFNVANRALTESFGKGRRKSDVLAALRFRKEQHPSG
jgi:KaiC/GvpD/RAD55 family RecA-like ATPase